MCIRDRFTTGWMGENHFASWPAALYGFVLLMAAIAYWILQQRIIASQGKSSILLKAVSNDWKGKASPLLYIIGIALSFASQWLAVATYIVVALMWLVPDQRIERVISSKET